MAAVLVWIGTAGLAACTEQRDPAPNTAQPAAAPDASGVADALRRAGLPVTQVVAVSPATDREHLLGRPGQYTSKVVFRDGRHPTGDEAENTIEVFASVADAMRRGERIAQASGDAGLSARQMLQGKAYLRLGQAVTPTQADEYRKAMLDGQIGM